jgi:signal transduction histidine kinase
MKRLFRTWPVAAAALGGLLLLFGTSVFSTFRKTEEIVAQLDQLNAHHRDVEGTLRHLRSDVQLSSIYIRDYLLDTDRAEAPHYRQQLTELRERHAESVKKLRTLLPPATAPRIDNLERKLDDYWQAFDPLFEWSILEKIVRSARFLRREVLPRREAVLAITAEIEKLNDANLAAQRAEVTRRETAFRDDLHRRMLRTLLLGFIVAVIAVLRLRTLERRSDEQRLRARQLSQQLVAAQEEERKKLTRELHDHVGQMLTALRMEIGRAARARSGPAAGQALSEAKRLLDTILRSVRDLVMGLRPSMLDDFGLHPALEWHVRDFRRRFGIAVDLALRGEMGGLPDQTRTCVYRIVQEALTNCARHAQARQIEITVAANDDTLDLTVADDGVGIDPRRARGMGLLGIEERVRELHGTFDVRAAAPSGTRLHVTLPITPPVEEVAIARVAG